MSTGREIVEAATLGKWEVKQEDDYWYISSFHAEICSVFDKKNAQFIAHFNPTKVGEMLDQIEQLKAENKRLNNYLESYKKSFDLNETEFKKLKAENAQLKKRLCCDGCGAQLSDTVCYECGD